MRIVSQAKMFEIPYEYMCLEIGSKKNGETEIIAYPVNGGDSYCWTLGVYYTKERALEVMKEIREHYAGTIMADKSLFEMKNKSGKVKGSMYVIPEPCYEMPKE